jgi:hypothetical protein
MRYLTAIEYATLLHRSVETVYTWCKKGLIPNAYRTPDGGWHIPRPDSNTMGVATDVRDLPVIRQVWVAQLLGTSIAYVKQERKAGRLPAVNVSPDPDHPQYFYTLRGLHRFLDNRIHRAKTQKLSRKAPPLKKYIEHLLADKLAEFREHCPPANNRKLNGAPDESASHRSNPTASPSACLPEPDARALPSASPQVPQSGSAPPIVADSSVE